MVTEDKKLYRSLFSQSSAAIYARQFSDNLHQGNPGLELLSSVFLGTN